jgi:hypothetical protein
MGVIKDRWSKYKAEQLLSGTTVPRVLGPITLRWDNLPEYAPSTLDIPAGSIILGVWQVSTEDWVYDEQAGGPSFVVGDAAATFGQVTSLALRTGAYTAFSQALVAPAGMHSGSVAPSGLLSDPIEGVASAGESKVYVAILPVPE